jgi:hypothetical protein
LDPTFYLHKCIEKGWMQHFVYTNAGATFPKKCWSTFYEKVGSTFYLKNVVTFLKSVATFLFT